MKKRILAAILAVAMVFSVCTIAGAEEKEVVYSQDFEGTVDAAWDGFSVVADPLDATNKVVSHTDNSWGQKLSGLILEGCDPTQVYTLKMSVYGDVAHVALSFGQNWDLVECTDGTTTEKGIVKMPYEGYNAVNVRTLAKQWDTVAVKFSGAAQYKFYIMTQPGAQGVNGGTLMFDDIEVYKGDVLAEVNEEIQAALPTPDPEPIETPTPGVNDEPSDEPSAGTDATATAGTDATATAAPTTAATPAATVAATPAATASATATPETPVKPKVTIKFKKKKVTIKKGKKKVLKVTLKNAKKAKFSVNKKGKKVVKLSKKKAKSVTVKGKKKGKATITAKASGKKATCKVTVKK